MATEGVGYRGVRRPSIERDVSRLQYALGRMPEGAEARFEEMLRDLAVAAYDEDDPDL